MASLQPFAEMIATGLGWIGRQGTRALAASIFIGLALPPLATLFKPIFSETLFVLLCLAFLRVDPAAVRHHAARRGLILAATAWMMIAVPLIMGLAIAAWSRISGEPMSPALILALTLQTAAPPITGSPALAALVGLDAALSLVSLIAGTAVAPLSAPLLTYILAGADASLSPLVLGLRLLAMLAGAALVAIVIRRVAGQPWIERRGHQIDGLNIIALFVFAVAFMDGVPAHALAEPGHVAGLLVLAFVMAIALGGLTALAFARAGRSAALSLAVGSACRNMGLMLAAAGAGLPDLVWLYIAMAQFPIYLLPHLLKRLNRPDEHSPQARGRG